jgi:hypothetical protein
MSEVLGDAEPVDDPRDDRGARDDRGDRYDRDDFDDYEYDDGFDARPGVVARLWHGVATPGALAIASLVISALNLLGPTAGYVVLSAITISGNRSETYAVRAAAIFELATGAISIILAVLAYRGADRLDDTAARRTPQMLAGASVLVAIFAGLEAATALILVANAHVPDNFGG